MAPDGGTPASHSSASAIMAGRRSIPMRGGGSSAGRGRTRSAWKTPPREIALARLARAEALGISYREYTAVLLDTGKHLEARRDVR